MLFLEPGAWNEYFLSGAWTAFIWFDVGALVIVIGLSLVRLNAMHKRTPVKINLQLVIYGVGLLSILLAIPCVTIRIATLSRTLIDLVATFLFSVCLYLVVLLWSALIGQTRTRASLLPLRIAIYVAILVTLVNFIYGTIFMLTWPTPGTSFSVDFSQFIFPASQLLLGGLFIFYGYKFYKDPGTTTSWQTRSAIIRLSIIILLGFTSFLMKAILNLSGRSISVITNVGSVAAIFIFLYLTFIIRAVAVALVLTVNMKVARRPTAVSADGDRLVEDDSSIAQEDYTYSWEHLRAGAGLQARGVNVMLEELDQYGTTTVEDVGLFASDQPTNGNKRD